MGAKGKPGTGGRPKGSPNKITTEMREMVLQATELEGGVDYLRVQARDRPESFARLLAKCIPQAHEIDSGLEGLPMVTFNFSGRPINGGKEASEEGGEEGG